MAVRGITLGLLIGLALTAFGDTLTGKVGRVVDGDTLYVLDANYQEHKIRLAGIDAPERKQAYRLASRKHLASIVAGKQLDERLFWALLIRSVFVGLRFPSFYSQQDRIKQICFFLIAQIVISINYSDRCSSSSILLY